MQIQEIKTICDLCPTTKNVKSYKRDIGISYFGNEDYGQLEKKPEWVYMDLCDDCYNFIELYKKRFENFCESTINVEKIMDVIALLVNDKHFDIQRIK